MKKPHAFKQDTAKLVALRHSLGWTQEEAAHQAGYSERLIRKLELGESTRGKTLVDVLTCYHEALSQNDSDWQVADFILADTGESVDSETMKWRTQRLEEYYETVFNQRHIDRVSEFIDKNIFFTAEGRSAEGREVIEQRAATLLSAFSPIKFEVIRTDYMGEIIFCAWKFRMKHVGTFLGIEPKGKWVKGRGNSIVRFEGELVVEAEDQWDVDHVIRQINGEGPLII
jgi:predicted ester cyclase/DNA-binding XRE family transcriptional regulator